jgi:hypothetical protein
VMLSSKKPKKAPTLASVPQTLSSESMQIVIAWLIDRLLDFHNFHTSKFLKNKTWVDEIVCLRLLSAVNKEFVKYAATITMTMWDRFLNSETSYNSSASAMVAEFVEKCKKDNRTPCNREVCFWLSEQETVVNCWTYCGKHKQWSDEMLEYNNIPGLFCTVEYIGLGRAKVNLHQSASTGNRHFTMQWSLEGPRTRDNMLHVQIERGTAMRATIYCDGTYAFQVFVSVDTRSARSMQQTAQRSTAPRSTLWPSNIPLPSAHQVIGGLLGVMAMILAPSFPNPAHVGSTTSVIYL